MRPRVLFVSLAIVVSPTGCNCPNGDIVELDADASSGAPEDMTGASSGSGDESTEEPFDASRWIGRYHFESVFLPFGERGDPHGAFLLVNFEIFPDSRATMFYDDCNFEEPLVIHYEWTPSEDGWLSLRPGEGETSLRYLGRTDVEALRVRLVEPCRELEFDADGMGLSFYVVRPGASCWVDKCTTPHTMQVDYCEGEEPEVACP